ncbi:conjugal transfer protein TraD [Sphingomonas sp. AP4-R1]|uniref:conjugal transfer protein TraD n=1 Tax=Sphingomonas sp. AP4-R1 TaxID=2735134 RepID=UPI001493C7DB|nr:conjugal transfer protein TraD [Sphingomonas sp. AP4-R1]QJU57397.1 conjugal transfer protein TraD [Sphingomonas sp. AP4-R1]
MRKPRNYDDDLKALADKARKLHARKVQQLGELVIATGADALPVEVLAGALIGAAAAKDAGVKEGWHAKGEAFFQGARRDAGGDRSSHPKPAPDNRDALSSGSEPGA